MRGCSCGLPWEGPDHRQVLARDSAIQWRSNPGQLLPHRSWIRENLPGGRQGFTCSLDDGVLRTWTDLDQVGMAWPVEWKTYGRGLDTPTKLTQVAMQRDLQPGLLVTLVGGNCPGPLRHWPGPCPTCGLPEAVTVADKITVAFIGGHGRRMELTQGADLARWLQRPDRLVSWMRGYEP